MIIKLEYDYCHILVTIATDKMCFNWRRYAFVSA